MKIIRRTLQILLAVIGLAIAFLFVGYFALLRPDIPYATLEQRYANASSRYVDLPGGIHMHYRDQGNRTGPTLLLIHGFGASLFDWEPWVSRLEGRYRVVSVDWPGHGLTRAPASFVPSSANNADLIESFSDKIGLGKVTIVGNSLGGEIAWVLTLRHPGRVERLVLIDASGWEWREPSPSENAMLAGLESPTIAGLIRGLDKSPTIRSLVTAAFYDPRLATNGLITRYVELSRAPGHRAILDRCFIESLRGVHRDGWATKDKLSKIAVPTLILWGDRDKLLDPGDAAKFAAAIAASKLILYHDAGHVPMEEVASQSAADLNAWITSTQPERN